MNSSLDSQEKIGTNSKKNRTYLKDIVFLFKGRLQLKIMNVSYSNWKLNIKHSLNNIFMTLRKRTVEIKQLVSTCSWLKDSRFYLTIFDVKKAWTIEFEIPNEWIYSQITIILGFFIFINKTNLNNKNQISSKPEKFISMDRKKEKNCKTCH